MGKDWEVSPLDTLTKAERSERMAKIRSKDTYPELRVRKVLSEIGYRYRVHYSAIPGRPDVAFPGRQKVIWVHGCFFHQHDGCALNRIPKSKLDFWLPKLKRNQERDIQSQEHLREIGWEYLIIWECRVGHAEELRETLIRFLGSTRALR